MDYEFVLRKSWFLFWIHIALDFLILIGVIFVGSRLGLQSFILFLPIVGLSITFLIARDFWNQSKSYLAFTEDGVLFHKGILSHSSREIPYDNIDKVEVDQEVIGRVLDFGDIVIYTGSDQPDIRFERADKPQEFKKRLYTKI